MYSLREIFPPYIMCFKGVAASALNFFLMDCRIKLKDIINIEILSFGESCTPSPVFSE